MYTFVIRNRPALCYYAKQVYGYFMHKESPVEGVKITIRNNDLFIHINRYYCVICNDICRFLTSRDYTVETNKKALEWIDKYYSELKVAKHQKNNIIK